MLLLWVETQTIKNNIEQSISNSNGLRANVTNTKIVELYIKKKKKKLNFDVSETNKYICIFFIIQPRMLYKYRLN